MSCALRPPACSGGTVTHLAVGFAVVLMLPGCPASLGLGGLMFYSQKISDNEFPNCSSRPGLRHASWMASRGPTRRCSSIRGLSPCLRALELQCPVFKSNRRLHGTFHCLSELGYLSCHNDPLTSFIVHVCNLQALRHRPPRRARGGAPRSSPPPVGPTRRTVASSHVWSLCFCLMNCNWQ